MFLQCRLGFITCLFCCSLGTIVLRISKNIHLFSSAFLRIFGFQEKRKRWRLLWGQLATLTQLRFSTNPRSWVDVSKTQSTWLHSFMSWNFWTARTWQKSSRIRLPSWNKTFRRQLRCQICGRSFAYIFRVKPNAYVDPDSLFQHSESNSPPCIWIRQRVNAWSASCTRPQSWRRWRSKPSLVWKTKVFFFFSPLFFHFWNSRIFDPSSSSSLAEA